MIAGGRTKRGVIRGIASFQELLRVGMVRAKLSHDERLERSRLAALNLSDA